MTDPAELALRAYIYDYLKKGGFTTAADSMRTDSIQKNGIEIQKPIIETPHGFLREWFGLFWDVYYPILTQDENNLSSKRLQTSPQQQQQRQQQQQQHQQRLQFQLKQQQQQQQQTTSQQQKHQLKQSFNNKQLKQLPLQQQQRAQAAQHIQLQRQRQQQQQAQVNAMSVQQQSQNQRTDNLNISDPTNPQVHLNSSSSLPLTNQNLFGVDQNNQQRAQSVSHPLLNQNAFRTVTPQSADLQLQAQQFQQQNHPLLLQSQRSVPPSTATDNRSRATSIDNRRNLAPSQIHSLSLESSLQKNSISQDQLSNPNVTNELLDGSFEGILPPVGSRNASNRNASNAAATAAVIAAATGNGRNNMSQINRGQPQSQSVSNSIQMRVSRMNPNKSRTFNNIPGIASEATSSARENISADHARQYKDVVEDESQPRNGRNQTSSQSNKKRTADQLATQKGGSSQPNNISPHGAYGVGNDGNVPTKRQRPTGVFPQNLQVSNVMQLQQQNQLQSVDFEVARGLQKAHSQGRNRNNQQQLHSLHPGPHAYAQAVDGVNNASFLDQQANAEKLRNGMRLVPRNGANANQAYSRQGQAQKGRQSSAQMQGRRMSSQNPDGTDPLPTNDGGFNMNQASIGNGPVSSQEFPNVLHRQVSGDGSLYPSRNEWAMLQYRQFVSSNSNPESLAAAITGNHNNAKKAGSGRGSVSRNGNAEAMDRIAAEGTDKVIDESSAAEIQGRNQMLLEGSASKDRAEQSIQGLKHEEIFKHAGKLQRTDELTLSAVNKSKGNEVASGGNGKQNKTNEKSKTEGSKPMRLSIPSSSAQQAISSSAGQGGKRDKGSNEGELENRSTKSERQPPGGRGGTTASQKSTASGGSTAVDKRTAQGSSTTGKRSRGRSRGRGGSTARRSKADRGGPPRGNINSRASGSQTGRGNTLDQKVASSASLQIPTEPRQAEPQHDSPDLQGNPIHVSGTGSNNVGMKSRQVSKQNTGSARQNIGQTVNKNTADSKLSFELGVESGADNRVHGISLDGPQAGAQLDGDDPQLLSMLPSQNGISHRQDTTFDPVGKVSMHNGSATNYGIDIPQCLTSGVDEEFEIGKLFQSMPNGYTPEGTADFGDGTFNIRD